ncbi:MAG: GH92 family glycosyl hydrolase, partial [Bacteroidales bacterium]|nr:GH92 family glycosyl hydrolase [Bacteroidales bacterium]
FSHTHLSGTGIGDLFDITVMPVVGEVTYGRGREEDPSTGMWSYADRSREVTRPGYYSVPLTRYGITAEMTATNRVGLHRYTFPQSEEAGIVINLMNGGCWDGPMDAQIERVDPMTGQPDPNGQALRGYRYSRGWADDQKVYFYAEFSKPFKDFKVIRGNIQIWQDEFKDIAAFAHAYFEAEPQEQIMMKVALSPVSMEGAYANMKAELSGWDFEATAKSAKQAWNEELGKIKIEGKESLKIFYTALYHAMIAPSTFCDVDGSYRGADGQTYENPGYQTYTTFSLWDTYRAAMPLYSIFQSERYTDIINTMLSIYKEQGKLPVWHLHGCETNCMVGNPGIIPVADAIVKDLPGIDYELAFEAMKASALRPDRGQEHRMKYGYIPCDLMNESVAYDLEYALADGALANAAKVLGKEDDYQHFLNRSKSYVDLFDNELGFIRGKDSRGRFRTEYSPFASTHRADDYCEGNGWQYTWLVPHDFKGLVSCFGTKKAFLDKLDSLFVVSSVIEGAESSPDISGLIGQYAHGNEPSHHILYFYTMAGQPWKTADKVREVLATLYSAESDGLSGNEDVGQMSSWYILSSLGFYEVEPASGRYWFGTPIFDKAEIEVADGTFRIIAEGNSSE